MGKVSYKMPTVHEPRLFYDKMYIGEFAFGMPGYAIVMGSVPTSNVGEHILGIS